MAKEDVVAAGLKAIQDAEVEAITGQLGVAFDAGVAEGSPVTGFTQADIDAAVKAKADEDQVKFDELMVKEQAEEALVEKIKALLFPQPVEPPVEPQPAA